MLWKARRRMLFTVALARGGRDLEDPSDPEGAGDLGNPSDSEEARTADGLTVGGFEHQVMLALLRRGELSSMGVVDELALVTGRRYPISSVLLALGWLEEAGMLSSRLDESPDLGGVHSRLQFRLTGKGRRALREARQTYLRLWAGLEPDLDDRAS